MPRKKKIEVEVERVQGAEYWKNRPLDDKEKDWTYGEENWLEGYVLSVDHPHRKLILDALKTFEPFGGVLELGVNTGPNLLNIAAHYPETQLAGIDVNDKAIDIAKNLLPKAILKVADYHQIPFESKEFEITIADAVLLYSSPEQIAQVLSEIDRVTKRAVILVERYADSESGEVVGHVWGRDYKSLFEKLGFEVEERALKPEEWETSKNWQKYGRLYVCRRV